MILAQAFSRYVLDLDGVVWRGDHAIAGAPETVRALRQAGKRIVFMTNNSWRTTDEVADRLHKVGAPAEAREIVTSSVAAQVMIEREVPGARGRAAYVIGGPGLVQAMDEIGLRIVDGAEAADASIVVVGIDRRLTYEKLRRATLAIRAGAYFCATNTDPTLPASDGQLWPGAGSIVAALRTATGVDPMVAGKPNAPMLEVARERLDGTPALVVGDRVDTDVLAANAAGWPSALALSGATGVPELAVAPAWPDFIVRDLTAVLRDVPHPTVRKASGPDLPAIATLLHEGGLTAGAARERVGRTVVAEVDRGKPLATAAWEPVDGVALLRSVATRPDQRGTGLGTHVVAAALRGVASTGTREVYLATTDAESFFKSCGFQAVSRDDVPDSVLKHPQLVRECPASATVMRLALPTTG